MAKDFSKCYRSYYHLSRAWYAETVLAERDFTDEVMFGLSHPDGGTQGEMAVRWSMAWKTIGHPSDPVPQLQVYDDAWAALATFQDVLAKMAAVDGASITPAQFCRLLESCGFVDETPTEYAYSRKSQQPTK